MLTTYLAIRDRDTLKQMFAKPKLVVMTSVASFIGSFGWFSAMSLQAVPYVKTLGQVEIFFTMLISFFYLKQAIPKKDIFALLLVGVAAVLVMWH